MDLQSLYQAAAHPAAAAHTLSGAWVLRTEPGSSRERQEDSLVVAYIRTAAGAYALAAVCDGVGGCALGDLASQQAVVTMVECIAGLDEVPDLGVALQEAVFEADLRLRSKYRGNAMTTLSAVLIDDKGRACAVNVGDSRVYSFGAPGIKLLSEDDNFETRLSPMGIIVDQRFARHLTQAVGRMPDDDEDVLEPHLLEVGSQALVLCTDGVHDCGRTRDLWRAAMAEASTIERLVGGSFDLVARSGERDNASMIALHGAAAVSESLRTFDFQEHDVCVWVGAQVLRLDRPRAQEQMHERSER